LPIFRPSGVFTNIALTPPHANLFILNMSPYPVPFHSCFASGILFGPHTGHQRGEHLCIDYFAEGDGSGSSENGHLLYPVELYNVKGYKNFATRYFVTCHARLAVE